MIQASPLKERIAERFSRAASFYDKVADVQYDIAQATLALIDKHSRKMLDIGCGTGRISQQLLSHADSVLGVDLSPGMIKFAEATHNSSRLSWLNADAEDLPLEEQTFDSAFSSMALQWCQPIDKAFGEIHRVLQPESEAYLSLMCKGSFAELENAWTAIGEGKRTNDFQSHNNIVDAAKACGFDVVDKTQSFVTYHDTIFELLGSIKAIGANTVTRSQSDKKMLDRKGLLALENAYRQNHARDERLPLTYQISFLQLKKS
ncbi:methyltransferase domain-containing protein [Alteromonadaceae bacterium M269]|nr:methyltransferase domain-containing protein [Alteromonadaceae bacterium M269]